MRDGLMVALGVAWPKRGDVRDAFTPLLDETPDVWLQLTVEQAFREPLEPSFTEPLDRAAAAGRLVGHGVFGSPWTVPPDRMSVDWLARTRRVLERWPVRFLTDHVGCCRSNGWMAAPLPLPASRALAVAAAERLAAIRDVLEVPVGLENLALAVSRDDVLVQPDLVEAVLDPVDGVLLLDLHNLWCQAVNFGFDPLVLLGRWNLARVRQIHIAGGRWMDHPHGRFRRDTHDGAVPEAVWALLPVAIAHCPNLEVVVLERLRGTLDANGEQESLLAEARRLRTVLATPIDPENPLPTTAEPPAWRSEPPGVHADLFAAIRADDRRALDAVAPGWWADERAWAVARDVIERWGMAVPV
jgi:uncharacterized protein (UPF0276 family)